MGLEVELSPPLEVLRSSPKRSCCGSNGKGVGDYGSGRPHTVGDLEDGSLGWWINRIWDFHAFSVPLAKDLFAKLSDARQVEGMNVPEGFKVHFLDLPQGLQEKYPGGKQIVVTTVRDGRDRSWSEVIEALEDPQKLVDRGVEAIRGSA